MTFAVPIIHLNRHRHHHSFFPSFPRSPESLIKAQGFGETFPVPPFVLGWNLAIQFSLA